MGKFRYKLTVTREGEKSESYFSSRSEATRETETWMEKWKREARDGLDVILTEDGQMIIHYPGLKPESPQSIEESDK